MAPSSIWVNGYVTITVINIQGCTDEAACNYEAAAIEGRFLGLPAVAVSLCTAAEDEVYYETAAKVTEIIIQSYFSNNRKY